MQAATYRRYGPADVVTVTEVPRPEISGSRILVAVHASTVTTADWRIRASAFPAFAWLPGRLMFGLFRPKAAILGGDFSGEVIETGPDARRFKIGDTVFGFATAGAHAEYLAIDENAAVALKPAHLSHEEAAATPFGALAALVFLRDFARLQAGERALILGATGGVGVFAVQLAKHLGAHVTAVTSAGNAALARALGADDVLDYTTENFARSGRTWDVILDTSGVTSFRHARRSLPPTGRFVPLEFGLTEIVQSLTTRLGRGPKVLVGVSGDSRQDIEQISRLLDDGSLRPVIDATYPLDRIADAHRRVESRHKRGAAVVTIAQPEYEMDRVNTFIK